MSVARFLQFEFSKTCNREGATNPLTEVTCNDNGVGVVQVFY